MSKTPFWWQAWGAFAAEDEYAQYPDPAEVVRHYRLEKRWTYQELAQRLEITAGMAQLMEKQQAGLDSFARRRRLALVLEIPPALLGLDPAHFSSEEREPEEPFWWVQVGYEHFAPGEGGYPRAGEVVKAYRRRKGWTQMDLGEALGLSEVSIRRLENRNDTLDSMARRRMLISLLEIPPDLLGLYVPRVAQPEIGLYALDPAVRIFSRELSAAPQIDLLNQYRTLQRELLRHLRSAAQPEVLARIGRWIRHLQGIVPLIRAEHRAAVLELEFHYQRMLLWTWYERYPDVQTAAPYLERMSVLARELYSLSERVPCGEALVIMLADYALVYLEQGDIDAALDSLEEARKYASECIAPIRMALLLRSALLAAHIPERSRQTLYDLEQVELVLRMNQFEQDVFMEPADVRFFSRLERARIYLVLQRPRTAQEELERAQWENSLPLSQEAGALRRATLFAYRARALLLLDQPGLAIDLALQALELAQQYRSQRLLIFLANLYKQLKLRRAAETPLLARLRWQLGALVERELPPWMLL